MRWQDSSSSRLMCMWNGICRRRSSFSCSGVRSCASDIAKISQVGFTVLLQ